MMRHIRNINIEFHERLTIGQRVADRVAAFGGSWTFILLFGGVMLAWVLINSVLLCAKAFDPYPYILLNLVLSMLAAMQAPVIMMSQNRQAAKDRLMANNDYEVNIKAEQHIEQLQVQLDHLTERTGHQEAQLREILRLLTAQQQGVVVGQDA
jgi:uncharacterized membrane protein